MGRGQKIGDALKRAIGVEGSFKEAILPMLGYNCINIFSGGSGYVIGLYFLAFLTDVENLSTSQAGLVIMLATLWDAVTDPAMGIITDRTRSRLGRHRRYILWGIPIMAVSYVMMWNSFGISAHGNATLTMLYYVLAYMLYKTAYTIMIVPHTAMLPELAPEYSLRTQYNSVGYLMNSSGMVPSFLLVACVFGFVQMDSFDSTSRTKFLLVGIVLAVFYSLAAIVTFFSVRERSSLDMVNPPFDSRYVFSEYYQVFRNRAFRQYFTISLFYMMATGFYSNSKYFFIKYVAQKNSMYNLLTTVAGVAEASAFPFNYAITMKFGKKKCGTITTPLMIAGLAIGLFVRSSDSAVLNVIWTVLLFASMVLYPIGFSGIGFVTNNIFPDITDVDEMITGRRREGVIATFSTLIKKSISGVMAAFVGMILQLFGLVTGDAVKQYEALHSTVYAQTAMAHAGVRVCVAVIPIACVIISMLSLRGFSMSKDDHAMIRAAIAERKEKGYVTLTDAQKKTCERIAGQKWESMWIGQPSVAANQEENHTAAVSSER
ncbi:MAG: MFS transporter [Clostridia bacterium]|nr:MFS transporter [Clostridia bacterium]